MASSRPDEDVVVSIRGLGKSFGTNRVLTGIEAPPGELYLRPGKYRLTIGDEQNPTIFSQNIDVPASPAGSSP